MTTNFDLLAQKGIQMVVNASDLQRLIHEDREQAFLEGIGEGARREAERMALKMAAPLTMKEAATLLGVSVRTIQDWRKCGKLVSLDYGGGIVRIERTEIERFKIAYRGLYSQIYQLKHTNNENN